MDCKCLKCEICGATSDEKIVAWVKRANMFLCSKHKKQIYEYGKITDPTKRTTQDKNEYLLFDDHAEIVLRDRENNIVANAIIDLEDVDRCKQHKWSISKKNTNKSYVRCKNTKENMSLQRFIMGYDGPLVVDHINRNTLDNRKNNLRIATVAENTANNGFSGIYKVASGRWKVKLRRYGKDYYSFGSGFETFDDAVKFRNDILAYVDKHRSELRKEFDDARAGRSAGVQLLPNGLWQATYCVGGKQIRESGFPTMEAAANRRAEMMEAMHNAC